MNLKLCEKGIYAAYTCDSAEGSRKQFPHCLWNWRYGKTAKAVIPLQPSTALNVPRVWGSQISWQSAHMKVVSLAAVRTGRLYPRIYSWYSFLLEAESTLVPHTAAGRIMSMKNSNDTIGNRTRDISACSAGPQPTAPPRALVRKQGKKQKIGEEHHRAYKTEIKSSLGL